MASPSSWEAADSAGVRDPSEGKLYRAGGVNRGGSVPGNMNRAGSCLLHQSEGVNDAESHRAGVPDGKKAGDLAAAVEVVECQGWYTLFGVLAWDG